MSEYPDNVPDSFDIINNHLEDYFDENEILVLHEIESEIVHTDIYIIKTAPDRNYYILMSSGMSALPMTVESPDLQHAEVLILLPPEWNINYDDFADENNYWPFKLLKQLSKYPHLNNTWLGWGHTIPLVKDDEPVNHNFAGVILLNSITLPEGFITAQDDEKTVNIYSVIPLYQEELDYVHRENVESLMERFNDFNISEVVDVARPNTCA